MAIFMKAFKISIKMKLLNGAISGTINILRRDLFNMEDHSSFCSLMLSPQLC